MERREGEESGEELMDSLCLCHVTEAVGGKAQEVNKRLPLLVLPSANWLHWITSQMTMRKIRQQQQKEKEAKKGKKVSKVNIILRTIS